MKWILFLVCLSSSTCWACSGAYDEIRDPSKGSYSDQQTSFQVPSDSTLILGTSAQPPTLAHGLLLAKLQQILHTQRIVLAPTRPYKKGVEGGNTALELSRVAMSHFDEVLNFGGLHYKSFKTVDSSNSHFVDSQGEVIQVTASPIEFLKENQSGDGSLYFMPIYRDAYAKGDPKKLFWISGADSVASVPSWTPRWREFFNFATWVIVARSGYDKIDVKNENPLRGVLDDHWLEEGYHYERLGPESHIYRAKDSKRPNILVINPNIPAVSSTQVRALLKTNSQVELRDLIQPAVLKRIDECGYYVDDKEKSCPPLDSPSLEFPRAS